MVSTDEACPDYADMLRNFEQAHDWIWQEFGTRPTIGWQLDAFGHSAANARIMAELGLEAVVFARMNEQEKDQRKRDRELQFIWQPDFVGDEDDGTESKSIFAHCLYGHYEPPKFIDQKWFHDGAQSYEESIIRFKT